MKALKISISIIFVLLYSNLFAEDNNLVTFESHNLQITLDVANQSATIVDSGIVTTNEVFNNLLR